MARDFRAKQLRTSIIIGSGSIESTKPHLGLVFYSASKASDFEGVRRTGGSGASVHGFVNANGLGDDTTQTAYLNLTHASIGHDVWCVFDGASHGTNASLLYGSPPGSGERLNGSTVLFLGDVVVSGSLFAERQFIEVDTTTAGDFRTPAGSSAFFDGGFAAGGVDITNDGKVRASSFERDGGNVSIKTTTSGDVDIHPISGITRFKFDANSSATLTVANNSHTTLATAENGNLTLDSAGTVTLDAASTANDAIFINSAGGLDIASVKALDITATNSTDGLINIIASANSAAALGLSVDGGTSAGIDIVNATGTSADSIDIQSNAGGIKLDAAQNIQLDANGGQVNITDNGASHFNFDCDTTSFTAYDDSNTSDFFKIAVDTNGKTTLSTTDDDGSLAHMHLHADGHLYFDSTTVTWLFRNPAAGSSSRNFFYLQASSNDTQWRGYGDGSADAPVNVFTLKNWRDGNTDKPSVRMETDHKLEFHDDSQFIHAPSDNNLTVKVNDSITLDAGDRAAGDHAGTGTTTDSGAVLLRNTGIHIGGAGTGVGVASVAATESPIRIFKATQTVYPASQNTDSGHVNWPFDGTSGSPVAQAGDLVISNRTSFNGVNANGNIVFDGAVTIGSQAVNNLTVTGDLLVQGTTTTLETNNLIVEDPFIVLAKGQGPNASDNMDAGFLVERAGAGVPNVAFIWDETNGDVFRAITTNSTANTAGDVVSSGHVPVAAQQFYLESSANKIDLNTDVVITAAADVTFTVAGGNVTPTANDGAALGSADKNWSDLFLADSSVLNFGDDQDVTLTHVHDTGLLINSGKQIQFGHADENISGDGTNLTVASAGDLVVNSISNYFQRTNSDAEILLKRLDSLSTGEYIGRVGFVGEEANGTEIVGAAIEARAEGAFQRQNVFGGLPNYLGPTSLRFRTYGDFQQDFNNPPERMIIASDGKVGIGTSTPTGQLQVENNGSYSQLRLKDTDAANDYVDFTRNGTDFKINANGSCAIGIVSNGGSGGITNYANNHNFKTATLSGSPIINFSLDGSNTRILANHANDLTFVTNPGSTTEIMRLDTSESSLLMASTNKIQFTDTNKFINNDGTDLVISSNNSVKLDGASAQLNFNSSNNRIYLDSNEIKFRDSVQTTPLSLSDIASVSPANGVMISATGANRARITGFTSIDSADFYLNQASHPANGQDDVFLYVGDDGGTRTNSAFKNSLAVSGSISMVDTADNLSATKFTQTSDNLIVTMNTSTAGNGNATLHNLLTLESASGLKLGTTAGSGNAGLYFQGAGLNLQKINTTVEGSAQDCIQIQGHLLPQADNSFNLGTESRRFANLYTGDLHLNNMGSSNDVDGTSGNWTIQEGEDNLYVINNLTGKKFKMMLQPVEDGE